MEVEVLVAQSYPALCNPMDCSPPGSSVHGILQAKILEWVAISFSRRSLQPRDRTQVSCIAGRLDHLSHQRSPKVYNINSLFSKYLRNYMPRTDLSTWDTVLGRGGLCVCLRQRTLIKIPELRWCVIVILFPWCWTPVHVPLGHLYVFEKNMYSEPLPIF